MCRFGVQFKWLAVCLQLPGLAAAAARLVDGLDDEDVLGAALQTVHGVVVLFDVGHDHPAIGRVTQTNNIGLSGEYGILELIGHHTEFIIGGPMNSDGVIGSCAELFSNCGRVGSCKVIQTF